MGTIEDATARVIRLIEQESRVMASDEYVDFINAIKEDVDKRLDVSGRY